MSTRPYPCQEKGSVYPHPSWTITFDWDQLIQARLPSSTPFKIQVIINTFTVYQCIIDDGESSCIMSSSAWKQLVSPTLIPSMTELISFDGRLCSPLWILPNLLIEMGGKIVLINVVVVDGLVDYNILLGCDFIYAMSVLVSSLFPVIIFPHEGCIITIDKLSYIDPSPQDSHNRISHHVAHIESMHYVSTSTSHETSTPLTNDPMPIEPPPHHLGLKDVWIHSSLGKYMHVSSPKPKRNHELSTTFFP
jgi:hypothetical protein